MIASLQRTIEPVNGSPTVPLVSPKDAGIRIPPKPIHHISVAAHGDAPKESTVVSKGFRATTMVGFASLPNQIHRKAVRRGFTFNLMIVGSPGLGKSSFINALFCSNIYCPENPGPSKRSSSESAVRVDSRSFLVNEADVKLRLCILDTPGFGQGLNNTECWQPIIKNIESHFDHYMRAELSVCRTTVGSGDSYLPSLPDDPRIHACIYFIPPGGHGLRQLDIETLKHLHAKVNLILVIGKADSMTPEECAEYKKVINQAISEHGIHLYAFPESVAGLGGGCDEKWLSEVRGWRNRQPFAVVSSDRWIEHADGKRIRGRSYPWGVVETENLAHNDFTALKNLLLNVHLQDLIDVTHSKHYANYYSTRLSSIAEASKFPVNEDAREPLSQLEIERIERQKRLTKLEADMEAVFEQKVQERTAKLSETERDLEQRAEQLNQNLATQLAEFEKQKREFDDARAIWESENRQALESFLSETHKPSHSNWSLSSTVLRSKRAAHSFAFQLTCAKLNRADGDPRRPGQLREKKRSVLSADYWLKLSQSCGLTKLEAADVDKANSHLSSSSSCEPSASRSVEPSTKTGDVIASKQKLETGLDSQAARLYIQAVHRLYDKGGHRSRSLQRLTRQRIPFSIGSVRSSSLGCAKPPAPLSPSVNRFVEKSKMWTTQAPLAVAEFIDPFADGVD